MSSRDVDFSWLDGPVPSLTQDLLDAHGGKLNKIVQHPFLAAAGNGTLPLKKLNGWLAQDTYYTRAYVRFMGGLLTSVGPNIPQESKHDDGEPDEQSIIVRRIFDLIIGALSNIQREMIFFEETAERHALFEPREIRQPIEPATQSYMDLFSSLTAGSTSHLDDLLVGMVVLWATELVYYRSWSYAKQCLERRPAGAVQSRQTAGDAKAAAAVENDFIPNWTSKEFAAFVEECRACVDQLAIIVALNRPGPRNAELNAPMLMRCSTTFNQILWLEEQFWPDMS